jgi:hypothetical protein
MACVAGVKDTERLAVNCGKLIGRNLSPLLSQALVEFQIGVGALGLRGELISANEQC